MAATLLVVNLTGRATLPFGVMPQVSLISSWIPKQTPIHQPISIGSFLPRLLVGSRFPHIAWHTILLATVQASSDDQLEGKVLKVIQHNQCMTAISMV